MKEARSLLKKAGKLAGLVEIRVENIVDLDIEHILSQPRPKVIITNRPTTNYSKENKIVLLYKAIKLGAEYVDIEIEAGKKQVSDIIQFSKNRKSKIILSYHNCIDTPATLFQIYKRLKSFNPSIIKIATQANDINDNEKIFKLLKQAQKDKVFLSAFCMGEKGEISRILAPRFGGHITYCSFIEGDETAPGQIPAKKLLNVYNYKSINKQTKIFGLVGNPVSQSRGIYVHNKFFKKNKLNAVYVNFLVNNIKKFFKTYSEYIAGVSVTIPHKQTAAVISKQPATEARSIKAVNTILKTGKGFMGFNTDTLAAIKLLRSRLKNKSVVGVLGTGGTARSAIFAAKSLGGEVIVLGRNLEKAQVLASEFECSFAPFSEIQKIKKLDVIINTTPVGMEPNVNASPIPKNLLNKEMLIVDFVYTPEITKLISDAHQFGCQIIPGTKIFETQAKLQQELFKSVI